MVAKNNEIEVFIRQKAYEKAFALMLKEFSRPLYALIFKMTTNHNDTDDILQNATIKIWQNLPKFKGESGVYTWCYTIAKNECLAWIRKNKVTYNVDDVVIAEWQSQGLDGTQIWNWLTTAVERLPPKQRNVFELKYFMDKSYAEIALITKTSVGGLKASYHHAVQKVREDVTKNLMS